MKTTPASLLFCVLVTAALSGCVSPKPTRWVDEPVLPRDFAGESYRATAKGGRLVIEVTQSPGFNVVGFDAVKYGEQLYVTPRHISSGGRGKMTFELDVSKYGLGTDWPRQVYWQLSSHAYPIGHPGFWSEEARTPWPRKKMEIVTP